jgi:hypothetical protein
VVTWAASEFREVGVAGPKQGKAKAEEGSSYQMNDRILAGSFRSYDVISPYIGLSIVLHFPRLPLNHLK